MTQKENELNLFPLEIPKFHSYFQAILGGKLTEIMLHTKGD
jgi:hypothetical protein